MMRIERTGQRVVLCAIALLVGWLIWITVVG